MSIDLVGVSTTNTYLQKESLYDVWYTLEIENSWYGRQFKIIKVVDGTHTVFQRKQIFINGFCAKYLKGFNRIQQDKLKNPISLKILENNCFADYEDLNSLFTCDNINVRTKNGETSTFTTFTVPVSLKIIGLIKYFLKEKIQDNFGSPKLSYFMKNDIRLENPYTLNYYGITDNTVMDFLTQSVDNSREFNPFNREKLWFDQKKFQEFQSNLIILSDLVCFFESDGTGTGTGFLIGENKIFTNYHVIKGMGGREFTIKFFYDGTSVPIESDKITINLNENFFIKNEKFDYIIIRLDKIEFDEKTELVEETELERINNLKIKLNIF